MNAQLERVDGVQGSGGRYASNYVWGPLSDDRSGIRGVRDLGQNSADARFAVSQGSLGTLRYTEGTGIQGIVRLSGAGAQSNVSAQRSP